MNLVEEEANGNANAEHGNAGLGNVTKRQCGRRKEALGYGERGSTIARGSILRKH